MRFLDSQRIVENMRLAAEYLGSGKPKGAPLKSKFFQALNSAQGTSIGADENDLIVEFDNPALVDFLVRRTVFSANETANDCHVIPTNERLKIVNDLSAAKDLIQRYEPNLRHIIGQLIGSVAAYRIPSRDGGSVSCCIGLIWLSPGQHWTSSYYAEMLVHEFVHNSLFLEDMVRGVMPRPELLELDDALAISAIRQTRRPYDKAFHSACVSAALMYFYRALGESTQSEKFLAPLKRTLDDLQTSDLALQTRGLDVLTENGRDILDEIRRFMSAWPDCNKVTATLQLA